MPNGGVPLHMALFPQANKEVVIYCKGTEMQIFGRQDWDTNGSLATPIERLSPNEVIALVGFLEYWIGRETPLPACQPPRGVKVLYDF